LPIFELSREAAVDPINRDYHGTRDQYLELLWAAQRVEDKRLTELILLRLKEMAIEMAVSPTPACEVIPFPNIIVHPVGPDREPDKVHPWPCQPLRHLLSIVCGYCAVVLFFGLFGLSPS
jgi:hypothetical protein